MVRSAALAAAGFAFLLGSARPTFASPTIEVNQGATTATAFATHQCEPSQGGGPLSDQDVWVFALPGPHDTSGDFVSLTAEFGANRTVMITAAADPGAFSNGGPDTAKAWITTPAGWTLQGATAETSGTADHFDLTRTCPASGAPSPSLSASASSSASTSIGTSASPRMAPGSPDPPESASEFTVTAASESPTPSASTSTAPVPSGSVNTGGGGSAISISSVFLGGGALLGAVAGIGFLLLARQRRDLA